MRWLLAALTLGAMDLLFLGAVWQAKPPGLAATPLPGARVVDNAARVDPWPADTMWSGIIADTMWSGIIADTLTIAWPRPLGKVWAIPDSLRDQWDAGTIYSMARIDSLAAEVGYLADENVLLAETLGHLIRAIKAVSDENRLIREYLKMQRELAEPQAWPDSVSSRKM